MDVKQENKAWDVCDCTPATAPGPEYFQLSLQNQALLQAGQLLIDETELHLQEKALQVFGPDFHNNFGGLWSMMHYMQKK
jgi:hypothetical protein